MLDTALVILATLQPTQIKFQDRSKEMIIPPSKTIQIDTVKPSNPTKDKICYYMSEISCYE